MMILTKKKQNEIMNSIIQISSTATPSCLFKFSLESILKELSYITALTQDTHTQHKFKDVCRKRLESFEFLTKTEDIDI